MALHRVCEIRVRTLAQREPRFSGIFRQGRPNEVNFHGLWQLGLPSRGLTRRSLRAVAVVTPVGSRFFHKEIGRSGGRRENAFFSSEDRSEKYFPGDEHESTADARVLRNGRLASSPSSPSCNRGRSSE